MSDNVIGDVQTRLLESLPVWYPDLNHGDFSLTNIQEKRFRWSHHHTLDIRDERGRCERTILVKRSRSHSTDGDAQDIRHSSDALMLEYQALSLLYQHFGENKIEGITAVRSLAYFSDTDTLVLEYVPGSDLLAIVRRAGRPWTKQSVVQTSAKAAYRAGRLLSGIHQIEQGCYPKKETFNGEEYYQRLQEKSETLLSLVSEEFSRKRLLLVKQAVQELAPMLQEKTIVSHLHRDLNLDNFVQLPDGRVYTIDTTLYQVGSVEEDIAYFLVGLDTLKQRVLAGDLAIRSSTIDALKQSFLDGYCANGHFSSRILLLFSLLELMQRWIDVLDALTRQAPDIIASAIQRLRINPFMLAYLDHIWIDVQKEWGTL
ncbi:MAG: phosphotransferase [Anaerolineae bacterium]|nr:phosphotransferase [Anaerolineae bacterium]